MAQSQSPQSTALTLAGIAIALLVIRSGLQSFEEASRPKPDPAAVPTAVLTVATATPSPQARISGPTPTPVPTMTAAEKSAFFQRMAEEDYARYADQYVDVPDNVRREIWDRYQASGP